MNLNRSEELLLMIKKINDALNEQTKTRSPENLDFKIKRSKQRFSFILLPEQVRRSRITWKYLAPFQFDRGEQQIYLFVCWFL